MTWFHQWELVLRVIKQDRVGTSGLLTKLSSQQAEP